MSSKIITHIEALEKAKSYCAYQERCHQEVELKLKSWKLTPDEMDYVLLQLLQDNYLNEERFARAFVGGKFRIKKWGKKKIIQKLKEKAVSKNCIQKGLEEIDDADYRSTLEELIAKKYQSINDSNTYLRKKKTAAYAYSRGYESELIWELLETY